MSAPEKSSHISVIGYLAQHTGAARLALLLVMMLATSMSEGVGLLLLVPITQMIVSGETGDAGPQWLSLLAQFSPPVLLGAVAVLVSLRAGLAYLTSEMRREIDLSLARRLRNNAFASLADAQWLWLVSRKAGDDGALIMGEADRVATLLDQAIFIVSAALTLTILTVTALVIAPTVALAVFFAAAVLALPIVLLRNRKSESVEAYADAYADLHSLASRGIDHLRAAKIANVTDNLSAQFKAASARLRDLELVYFRHSHRLALLLQICAAVLLAALVYGALFMADTRLELFVPLLIVLARAAPLLGALIQAWRRWRHTLPAFERLSRLISQARRHAEERFSAGPPVVFEKELRLRTVDFAFEGRADPVFSRLDLGIPHGSLVAITGPSGSGKSTLADLVAGLLKPQAGALEVDTVELGPQERRRWRSQIAYAQQNPFLFEGTIAENLTWGRLGVDERLLHKALREASADFVFSLPDGLETQVGVEGLRFSGGERQRIALARALLREPDLLILDEVTSALDRASRDAIGRTIARLKGRLTILLLTHDEALLTLADKVIDLGRGDEALEA